MLKPNTSPDDPITSLAKELQTMEKLLANTPGHVIDAAREQILPFLKEAGDLMTMSSKHPDEITEADVQRVGTLTKQVADALQHALEEIEQKKIDSSKKPS